MIVFVRQPLDSFHLDPPRPNEGEGSVEDKIRINHRYLVETLKVGTL